MTQGEPKNKCTFCQKIFHPGNPRRIMVLHVLNCHRYCMDCHVDLGTCSPIDHMESVHGWNLTCQHCGFKSFYLEQRYFKDKKGQKIKRKHRDVCAENALKELNNK